MPTLLLLDRSLSMARRPSADSKLTYLELAVSSAHQVLAHLSRSAPAEFVALGLVGSELELAFPFTQDVSAMQQYLPSVGPRDAARLAPALEAASHLAIREWGPGVDGGGPACRILLLTDDGGRAASTGAAAAARALAMGRIDLTVLCLRASIGTCLTELQQINSQQQQQQQDQQQQQQQRFNLAISSPADCSLKAVSEAVQSLCQSRLSPALVRLHCGHSVQSVELHPGPTECERLAIAGCRIPQRFILDRDIRLIGFLQISEIYSPAVLSRHLVLPAAASSESSSTGSEHLTTLLQAALRADSYVALATLGSADNADWYCFLHAHPGGRRCALLLSVLEPGPEPAVWLGKIPYLAPASDFDEAALANVNPFPVKPKGNKPSYAASCIVWTKQASVVADVQKVSRWARKLPDKASQFYQELNRLRRHALTIGFVELLTAIRDLLQRECDSAVAANERQAEHLRHAVAMLQPPHWTNEIGPPPQPAKPRPALPESTGNVTDDGVIDLTVTKK